MAADEVLQLAYEAATSALKEQDATLGNLRNRATGLLAAAAVGTSFATGVGLYKAEPGNPTNLPSWAGWPLLGLMIAIGVCVMITLWPTSNWKFGVQASTLVEDQALGIDKVHKNAVRAMVDAAAGNDTILNRRFWAYRIGVGALIIEVIVLIVGVLFV